MNCHKLLLLTITVFCLTACNQTTKSNRANVDSEWLNKKELSIIEVIDSVKSEINSCESFKYTSQNTALVNFYGGQKVKTFILDKKGNAMSSRNGEQYYRINGKVSCRNTSLMEDGIQATVITDVMNRGGVNQSYFDRNTPYVRDNGIINIEFLKDCPTTMSLTGNTLAIHVSDLSNTNDKNIDKEYKKNAVITYTPGVGYKCVINCEYTDEKPSQLIFGFEFNTDDEVKLLKLMKVGSILSSIND